MGRAGAILLSILLFCADLSWADVGETFELRHRRDRLIGMIDSLRSHHATLDSAQNAYLVRLYQELAAVDTRMIGSMSETISREQAAKQNGRADRTAWAKATILLLVILSLILALHRISLRLAGAYASVGLITMYGQAAQELIRRLAPTLSSDTQVRISPVVAIGVVCMAISLVALLYRLL